MSRDSRRDNPALAFVPVAAFNTGDTQSGTEVNSQSVDLEGTTGRRYRRAVAKIVARGVNTSNRQWKVGGNFQHSTATGSGWADLGTTFSDTQLSASGTNDVVVRREQTLEASNRYVRFQMTPQAVTDTGGNTSATGGTLTYAGILELMDSNRLPATG